MWVAFVIKRNISKIWRPSIIECSKLFPSNNLTKKEGAVTIKPNNELITIAESVKSQSNGFYDITLGKISASNGFSPNFGINVSNDIDNLSKKYAIQNKQLIRYQEHILKPKFLILLKKTMSLWEE